MPCDQGGFSGFFLPDKAPSPYPSFLDAEGCNGLAVRRQALWRQPLDQHAGQAVLLHQAAELLGPKGSCRPQMCVGREQSAGM
jgi:hypothetical protein